MRLRLLRRRLTISAPRMAVRSAMPWPLRWVVVAVVLGFCAAIGLWAFEFGKDIAGLDHGSRAEVVRLRTELQTLHAEFAKAKEARDRAQSIADTAGTLVIAEKAAQEKVAQQARQLEEENRKLKDDLGFFEKLLPTGGVEGVAIRGLQAELQNESQLKWQVLLIQASKNAKEFSGRMELSLGGTLSGKPWTVTLAPQTTTMRQYARFEGLFEIPAHVVVKTVSARVLEGTVVKATQSVKL